MFSLPRFMKYNNIFYKFNNICRKFCDKSIIRGSTIYALSSGQGKCGVAVIRISGVNAKTAIEKMTKINKLEPRQAYLRNICNPQSGETIDKGICLWFPGPNSFTGEDIVEFQVHGGTAILSAIMSSLSKLKFQPALPGEFTRRAFFNNKLDLIEIEGLADLIHAETEQQRKQALYQSNGNLSNLYTDWRKTLLMCLAQIEAYIDFHEEDNIQNNILEQCNVTLKNFLGNIEKHLTDGRKGEILRSGIKTVILGEPNVGKSSLMNSLVKKNATIVTSIPGTTRDVIEVTTNIFGYPIVLVDTAGLNKFTKDVVEIEGIKRARDQGSKADFIILVISAIEYIKSKSTLPEYIHNYINKLEIKNLLLKNNDLVRNSIIVVNKIDLLSSDDKSILKKSNVTGISCNSEEGFQDLLQSMKKCFEQICGNPSIHNPIISQERHRNHIQNCHEYLLNYLEIISHKNYDIALASQEIHEAAIELGKVTGHISTEEVLDTIFKNYCIGK